VSDSSDDLPPVNPPAQDDDAAESWPPAHRPWSALTDLRTDLRAALALVGALALAGVPAGLLWWWLAPRADFRITVNGPVAIGSPSSELLVADDGVLALILAGLGVLAGIVGWRLRRRRGLATLLGLVVGTALAGVVAWRLGMLLAPAPTKADLGRVGSVVTTGLSLGALSALALGPFAAILAYLLPAAYSASDDLGRSEPRPAAPAAPPSDLESEPEAAVAPSGSSPRACEG
jgi:hypothetical protein